MVIQSGMMQIHWKWTVWTSTLFFKTVVPIKVTRFPRDIDQWMCQGKHTFCSMLILLLIWYYYVLFSFLCIHIMGMSLFFFFYNISTTIMTIFLFKYAAIQIKHKYLFYDYVVNAIWNYCWKRNLFLRAREINCGCY